MFRIICYSCSKPINSRYLMKVEPKTFWHEECLTCRICQTSLYSLNSCYWQKTSYFDGPVCKRHRKFCLSCNKQILEGESFVEIGKVYRVHAPDCLKCFCCQDNLKIGSFVRVFRGKLICNKNTCKLPNKDYGIFEKFSSNPLIRNDPDDETRSQEDWREFEDSNDSSDILDRLDNIANCDRLTSNQNHVFVGLRSFSLCENNNETDLLDQNNPESSDGCSVNNIMGYSSLDMTQSNNSNHRSTKHTRMRTVLSEGQLAHLRACYASNPRPDSVTKEQLSYLTGLNCRVIRVWFQNKRCKDKKRLLLNAKR